VPGLRTFRDRDYNNGNDLALLLAGIALLPNRPLHLTAHASYARAQPQVNACDVGQTRRPTHQSMEETRQRYRLNVVGDFYVADGCCTLCGVPGVTAPGLFGGFDASGNFLDGVEQCWVKRQPESETEFAAMIQTMATQELDCIRYSGANPDIMKRLRDAGEGDKIDAR
jgi:hypothetical protein